LVKEVLDFTLGIERALLLAEEGSLPGAGGGTGRLLGVSLLDTGGGTGRLALNELEEGSLLTVGSWRLF
jgi:hypothetical protein